MFKLSANPEVTLSHGLSYVRLRPSLRAALHLERLHDGFPALFERLAEFHIGTITEIVMCTATDKQAAIAFLASFDQRPLIQFKLVLDSAVHNLCAAFIPEPNDDEKPDTTGKPMAWADYYRQLYRQATGWLGWTPETAWNATPAEIVEAYAGYCEQLQAIYGSPDNKQDGNKEDIYSPERLKQVEELGHDPTFDREGLQRLKASMK